jgi:hypothetical protein
MKSHLLRSHDPVRLPLDLCEPNIGGNGAEHANASIMGNNHDTTFI